MKIYVATLFATTILLSCTEQNGDKNEMGNTDSVNTAILDSASYKPKVEADTAARQMNLDSTQLNDSSGNR